MKRLPDDTKLDSISVHIYENVAKQPVLVFVGGDMTGDVDPAWLRELHLLEGVDSESLREMVAWFDLDHYRMELILRSEQVVPLRNWYTPGKRYKERRAQQLRSALRLGSDLPKAGG